MMAQMLSILEQWDTADWKHNFHKEISKLVQGDARGRTSEAWYQQQEVD